MIARLLTRWLHGPESNVTPAKAAAVLSRRAHDKQRALIRKTAREMRERLGLPPHPLLDR